MNLDDLKKPFPPDAISWRVGSTTKDKTKGMALAYLDARDVMGRLDAVCGFFWQAEYIPMPNGTCCCRVGIKVGDEWVWRANGAINLTDSSNPDQKEMTEKGSYSDAFKRAAVLWGVGQYLYDLDSPWVELETYEKNGAVFVKGIKAGEFAKLRALLGGEKPKKEPYKDEDGQGQNWIDEQKRFIKACKSQEDVQGWVESRTDALARLKRQNLPAWNTLRAFKESRIAEIIKELEPA